MVRGRRPGRGRCGRLLRPLVAYHEAGHVVGAWIARGAVQGVAIVGDAGLTRVVSGIARSARARHVLRPIFCRSLGRSSVGLSMPLLR
jgi:hypothetical protein